ALMETGKIDVFAFIGTNKGANDLKRLHPKPHRLKSILGLDAKNPAIVLPDADIDNAVTECVAGALSFNGQRCTALKIIHVHRSIVDDFIQKFNTEVDKLKPGMPWENNVNLTPLPEPGKVEYLIGLLDDAKKHGAEVVNNGGDHLHTFFSPAVVYPVNNKMRLYSEEQFGPIVPIIPFDDDDEPIQYVVSSNFGQQVSIFGTDSKRIAKFMDAFVNQVGRINLNAQCQRGPDTFPFNGRKDSAEGTLSVSDALRVFSIRTLVATKDSDSNKQMLASIIRNRESAFLSTDYIIEVFWAGIHRPFFYLCLMMKHVTIRVSGKVQGVLFRASTEKEAQKLKLSGIVRYELDGSVYIEAEGNETAIEQLIVWCRKGPERARVDKCEVTEGQPKGYTEFRIER